MNDYFNYVLNRMTIDDLSILGILYDSEAFTTFKGVKNKELLKMSQMSEAKYRKTINRLVALSFVESDSTAKEHSLFINQFGCSAIRKSLLE